MNTTTSSTKNVLYTNIDTGTISIIFAIIAFAVYIPLVLYLAYPLYKGRNGMILQKRHSDLTLWAIFALILNIAIVSLFQLLFWSQSDINIEKRELWYRILFCTTIILLQFVGQFFFTIFNIRLWITYYDIQYFNLMTSNEWRNVIDEEYNITKSFFIKKRGSLGNKKCLKIALWICCTIVTLITIVLVFVDIYQEHTLQEGYMVLYWIFMTGINIWIFIILAVILYIKLRGVKYFDDFYVLTEFTTFFKVLVVGIILFMIIVPGATFIVISIFPALNKIENDDTFYVLLSYVAFHSYIIFFIVIIYIMTRYIIKKLQNDPALIQQYGDSLNQISYHRNIPKRMMENAKHIEMNKVEFQREYTVFTIFKKEEYFKSFLNHLALEFSQECILSLIEFLQFRDFAQDINDIGDLYFVRSASDRSNSSTMNDELTSIEFPPNIPKSSIVYNKHEDDRFKAQRLFEKYIKTGSDFEINISSRLRSKLTDKFQETQTGLLRTLSSIGRTVEEDKSIKGLPFVFDKACEEMLRLLRYSFARYRNKPEFLKLEKYENKQKD